ncbi:MAG: 50S ribosomal protein L10, partial [Verrucomicrobia bacterium 21-51-4]
VAKVLVKFAKDKEKLPLKAGVMDNKVLSSEDIVSLSKLPSLEVLRAQLLGLLNTPAQQLLRVFQAVPQGVLNVLQAKSQQ